MREERGRAAVCEGLSAQLLPLSLHAETRFQAEDPPPRKKEGKKRCIRNQWVHRQRYHNVLAHLSKSQMQLKGFPSPSSREKRGDQERKHQQESL